MRVISIIKPFRSIWRFPRRFQGLQRFGAPYEEQCALCRAIEDAAHRDDKTR